MNLTSDLPIVHRTISFKKLVAASVVLVSLFAGVGSAGAISVVVEDEPIVLDVAGLTVTLDLPAGAEITDEEIALLWETIIGGSVEDFKRNLEAEVDEVLRLLKDTLQFIIIPFLEKVLAEGTELVGDVTDLVVELKVNLEGVLANGVCVRNVWKLGSPCVTVG